MKLFIDMDGVLCNFQLRCKTLWPHLSLFVHTDKNDIYKNIAKMGEDFWIDMEWTSTGKHLWEYVKQYDPIILSAPLASDFPGSVNGKIKWLKNNVSFSGQYQVKSKEGHDGISKAIFCNNKHHFVKKCEEKHILIDDTVSKCDSWTLAGGIAINYIDTIYSLSYVKDVIEDIKKRKS